jgi:hypothetical protein
MSQPKIAFFMSFYKRPEYTELCMKSIKDSQEYVNTDFYIVEDDNPNVGLRNRIIDFFEVIKDKGYDILIKMDSDCMVPRNYVNDMVKVLTSTDADILSPNVIPSNAAFTYGREDLENKGYRPAEIVGGLWCMKADLIKDMYFERHPTTGLMGAISILKQICVEKEPKIGWVADVTVEDVGHWSGKHQLHIKSKEHETYSKEAGRQIAWRAL